MFKYFTLSHVVIIRSIKQNVANIPPTTQRIWACEVDGNSELHASLEQMRQEGMKLSPPDAMFYKDRLCAGATPTLKTF
jgi:hypothetical protein